MDFGLVSKGYYTVQGSGKSFKLASRRMKRKSANLERIEPISRYCYPIIAPKELSAVNWNNLSGIQEPFFTGDKRREKHFDWKEESKYDANIDSKGSFTNAFLILENYNNSDTNNNLHNYISVVNDTSISFTILISRETNPNRRNTNFASFKASNVTVIPAYNLSVSFTLLRNNSAGINLNFDKYLYSNKLLLHCPSSSSIKTKKLKFKQVEAFRPIFSHIKEAFATLKDHDTSPTMTAWRYMFNNQTDEPFKGDFIKMKVESIQANIGSSGQLKDLVKLFGKREAPLKSKRQSFGKTVPSIKKFEETQEEDKPPEDKVECWASNTIGSAKKPCIFTFKMVGEYY